MTDTQENDGEWPPSDAEVAALKARTLWALLAGVAGDEDRFAAEAVNIVKTGYEATLYAMGALTARAAAALILQHGSREAVVEVITAELVDAEMTATDAEADQ